jgi:phage terminase small subunit
MAGEKLTRKQQAFIDAYMVNGFNGRQAAIKAGYSEDTATEMAYENLTKPHIQNEVKRLMRDFIMPAEEVLSRLTDHARGDLGDVWDESTGQVDWKKARSLGKTGLIKRIKHKTTRVTRGTGDNAEDVETFEDEIELHNPQSALQMLGKYHEILTDKLKIEDWRDKAIADIRAGKLNYGALAQAFDNDLANELFALAGIPIVVTEDESTAIPR